MKKIPLVCLIGLLFATGLPISALAGGTGGIPEADRLYQAGQYAQAEAAYKEIIQKNPGTDIALAAQRGLAVLYAKTGKEALLGQAWQRLTTEFGGRGDMASILCQIGDECRNANRFGAAMPIYQYVVDHWPRDETAMVSQANLVSCLLCLKDQAGANGAFVKLQSEYVNRPNFRRVVYTIGEDLRWRNINAEAARQMYGIAASGDVHPDTIQARMGLAISCIRMKDFEAAKPVVEGIASDFGNDPRITQAICHIADAYRDGRSHVDARRLYQYVVDHYPNDEYAMWSQAGIAISAIDSKDEQIAQTAIEKLRTDYSKRSDFAVALCAVADNYRWREGFAKAKDLYALAATASPNHPRSIWFQMGLAICSICVNDPNTAGPAIAKLHTEYRNDPGLAQALYEVGATFGNAKQYDKAAAELNQVINTWPDDDYAMLAKVGLGLIQVAQGDDTAAEMMFQKILSDYRNHPKFAQAVHLMAEAYLNRAMTLEQEEAKRVGSAKYAEIVRKQEKSEAVKDCYQKAIQKWRIIIEELPPTPYTVQAWYFTGVIYRRHLGQPEKALPYYEKVANEWPDYDHAWSAQAMIAKCYERLKDAGKVPPSEAEPKIEQAYKAVVEMYPTCPLAREAHLVLGRIYLKKEAWEEAARYYSQFLEKYPRAQEWPITLVYLGVTYERKGQIDAAVALYRKYVDTANPSDTRVRIVRAKIETMEGAKK